MYSISAISISCFALFVATLFFATSVYKFLRIASCRLIVRFRSCIFLPNSSTGCLLGSNLGMSSNFTGGGRDGASSLRGPVGTARPFDCSAFFEAVACFPYCAGKRAASSFSYLSFSPGGSKGAIIVGLIGGGDCVGRVARVATGDWLSNFTGAVCERFCVSVLM